MSDFKINSVTCPKCRTSHYSENKCGCREYQYRFEETSDPDDWRTGHFHGNAEDAATEIAEEDFRDFGGDPNRYEDFVTVKDSKGKETRFRLTAKATVSFYAEELVEKK